MSVKGSWPRGKASSYCIRDCSNRDIKCKDCIRIYQNGKYEDSEYQKRIGELDR